MHSIYPASFAAALYPRQAQSKRDRGANADGTKRLPSRTQRIPSTRPPSPRPYTHAGRNRKEIVARMLTEPSRRQLFITHVIGENGQPDIDIVTFPDQLGQPAIADFEEFRVDMAEDEDFRPVRISQIVETTDVIQRALVQAIADGATQEGLSIYPSTARDYAEAIYKTHPLPIMNSPLSGMSMSQMVEGASSTAAFLAVFQHGVGMHEIALWFLFVGGTRLIVGATDSCVTGLKKIVPHFMLKWTGVPDKISRTKDD